MPSSIKLYTTGNMDAAHMDNSPSEATGHPVELALDNNLDTYWKSTSTADVEFENDLSEAKTVGCVLLFIRNYKEITNGQYNYYWSDNGTAWTVVSGQVLTDANTPIRIITGGLPLTHRYWKLKFYSSLSHVVELAGVWWGSYYNIAQGNLLPQGDEDQFYNRVGRLAGGRLAVAGINRNLVENPSRRYHVKAGTPYSNMLSAFRDSRGIRHLLVMNEGATQATARVVRFADDILPYPIVGYSGLHEVEIGLRGVPYIDDGDSY